MKVIPPDDLWVSELGQAVEKGKAVDVPPEIGNRLVEQGWSKSKAKAAPKVKPAPDAKVKPSSPPDDEKDVNDG